MGLNPLEHMTGISLVTPFCPLFILSHQVNLFFLLNIVRVLITKLKVTHQAESSLYMKAVRATLILVPLLGIQFVLLPYKPAGRVLSEIYDYVMHILMHYQVSLNWVCSFTWHKKNTHLASLEGEIEDKQTTKKGNMF